MLVDWDADNILDSLSLLRNAVCLGGAVAGFTNFFRRNTDLILAVREGVDSCQQGFLAPDTDRWQLYTPGPLITRTQVADLELGEMTAMTVTQTCHAQHHKCRSCERTRSVKIRVLSWFLAKLSLILVIVITSAASTFFYHKILPDDVQHSYATASSVDVIAEPRGGTRVNKETTGTKDTHGAVVDNTRSSHGPVTAAHLKLVFVGLDKVPYLRMMREGQFFTSGAVREDGGALLVTRQCLLMISADVILSSMMSKASNGPSTVMVCLTLERGAEPLKRVRCVVTHLREREEQLARVWTLFKAEADDRITVDSSWPSYVISDNADNRQSIFTAFEVGR